MIETMRRMRQIVRAVHETGGPSDARRWSRDDYIRAAFGAYPDVGSSEDVPSAAREPDELGSAEMR